VTGQGHRRWPEATSSTHRLSSRGEREAAWNGGRLAAISRGLHPMLSCSAKKATSTWNVHQRNQFHFVNHVPHYPDARPGAWWGDGSVKI